MLVQSGRMQMQANIVTHTFFERVCMAAAMQLNQPKLQNKPKTAHNLDVTHPHPAVDPSPQQRLAEYQAGPDI